MDQQAIPDIYADSVSVTAGPYGFTLTFLVTDPPVGDESGGGTRPVGRIRLSRELAGALSDALQRAAGNAAASTGMTESRGAAGS